MADLFKVKCLICGENFGLTETEIISMTECRCQHCGAKMNIWQFCELKHEYYTLMLKLHKVVSAGITPLPNIRLFTWELTEADGDIARTLLWEIKNLECKGDCE